MNIYLSIQSLFASQDLCKTNVNNPWYNSLGNMAVDVDLLGDSLLRSLLKMKSSMILPPQIGSFDQLQEGWPCHKRFLAGFWTWNPQEFQWQMKVWTGIPQP